jgi:hypothetical protein
MIRELRADPVGGFCERLLGFRPRIAADCRKVMEAPETSNRHHNRYSSIARRANIELD